MSVRYLEADRVRLQNSAPAFVEPGHCYWCNKLLTGKATKYCRPTEEHKRRYTLHYDGYLPSVPSECAIDFSNWWYSRPAYVRATFIRDDFICQECGLHPMREDKPWLPDLSRLECDHIIPLARGGKTSMDNLQTLCKECNRKKGVKVPSGLEGVQKHFRGIPSNPLCGEDWLKAHLADHTPEEIGSLTIKIGYNRRLLPPIYASDKSGTVKTIMREGVKDE